MAPSKRKRKLPPGQRKGTSPSPARVMCPACQKAIPAFYVNSHLDLECTELKSTPEKSSPSASNFARGNVGLAAGGTGATERSRNDDGKIIRNDVLQFGESNLAHRQGFKVGSRLGVRVCGALECTARSDDGDNKAEDVEEACQEQNGTEFSFDQRSVTSRRDSESAHVATEGRNPSKTAANSYPCSLRLPESTSTIQQSSAGQKDSNVLGVQHSVGHSTGPSSFLCRAPLPQAAPKGLLVLEDFITPEEEEHLLCCLDADVSNPWKLSRVNGVHWGKAYGNHIFGDGQRRVVTQVYTPMPSFLVQYEERMRHLVPALKDFFPNEMNSIDYRKAEGHYLKAHMDDRQILQLSGTVLVNLSLAGTCFMSYTRERGQQEVLRVQLPRRSLQVLTGESRYSYKHGIEKKDIVNPRRVSMTFRQSVESH